MTTRNKANFDTKAIDRMVRCLPEEAWMKTYPFLELGRAVKSFTGDHGSVEINRGPSLHQIEHCLCAPDFAHRQPLEFDINAESLGFDLGFDEVTIRAYVESARRLIEFDPDMWQLGGTLWARTQGPPTGRPDEHNGILFVGNYNTKSRSGWIYLTPYMFARIKAGENLI